jgi:hypothetical protein
MVLIWVVDTFPLMGDDDREDSRDEGGRWSPQYKDEDFISAIESLPVAGTQHIADEVGCSYDLAYRRLKNLEEEGRVKSEKVGGSFVWLVPQEDQN